MITFIFLAFLIGVVVFLLSEVAKTIKAVKKIETVTNTKTINVETEVTVKKINSSEDFQIVNIDGCEYIVMEKFYPVSNEVVASITHKGNCKYCKNGN
jgi:hypothetical protein